MASRIFGTASVRWFLRSNTIAKVPGKAVVSVGNAAGGGSFAGGWKNLGIVLSSVVVGSSWSTTSNNNNTSDEREHPVTRLTSGEKQSAAKKDNSAAFSIATLLFRQCGDVFPRITTTLCEANDVSLDADTEAEVEAALKRRRTSPEELQERREQRQKFLNNQTKAKQERMRRRMTNVGRFSLVSETKQNPSVPVLVLAMTGKPYFAEDFRRLYRDRRVAEKHPRFGARLDATQTHFVFDSHDKDDESDGGKTNQKVTGRDNVRDVVFPAIPFAELKDRVNDASLYEPLDLKARLWEAWTATGGTLGQSGVIPSEDISKSSAAGEEKEVESLLLFRAHHCMADGVSLGALFGDLMDEGPELEKKIRAEVKRYKKKKKGTPWWKKLLFALYFWIWGSLKALLYQTYLYVISWYDRFEHDDPWIILKALSEETRAGADTDHPVIPPRSLSWASVASVEGAKRVSDFYSRVHRKQTGQTSKVTINDIFCSCVSAAIVKQLAYHRAVNPRLSMGEQPRVLSLPSMNLVIPVHLHGGILLPGQSLGNKIGAMVSRIPGERIARKRGIDNDDRAILAQERLLQVHSVLNARKQTPAAMLSYLMAAVMGYLSPSSSTDDVATKSTGYSVGSSSSSWTPWLFRKAHANASVVVTNVRGPESSLHLEGRPVRASLAFLPLPAGVPVGVVVYSYNNRINLTVTAEEYAVPDADQFMGWVKDEYELLKQKAEE